MQTFGGEFGGSGSRREVRKEMPGDASGQRGCLYGNTNVRYIDGIGIQSPESANILKCPKHDILVDRDSSLIVDAQPEMPRPDDS